MDSSNSDDDDVIRDGAAAGPDTKPGDVADKPAGSPDAEKQRAASEQGGEQPPPPPPYSVFTPWQKRLMVAAAATTAIFSPLSAQIYLPALNVIEADLGMSSTRVNLTITTYMIFQGITPMFIGSLADSGGRRPAYLVCFVIYIAANIGLALAPGYAAILGLRCLQSAGSSSTVALCMAVVADIVTSAERGQYVGFTAMPSVLGPALGPIIGGLLSQYLGWRAIFWFLAISAGVVIVLMALFMPETCRRIVGDGSVTPPLLYRSVWQLVSARRARRREKPDLEPGAAASPPAASTFTFKPPNVLGSLQLLLQKETGLLLGTSALVFAGFYATVSAMPMLYKDRYGYNDIEVGLMYLPLSLGSVVAASIAGFCINRSYSRHHARLGLAVDPSRQQDLSRFPIERARLEVGLPLLVLAGAALVAWGWAMDARAPVAAQCVVSVFIGVGIIGFNNTTNALLVDIHPGKAGTATAANNLTRCLVGAGASAAIVPLIGAIGVGWAFTLVGGLYALSIGPMLLIMSRGVKWRAQQKARDESKKEARPS